MDNDQTERLLTVIETIHDRMRGIEVGLERIADLGDGKLEVEKTVATLLFMHGKGSSPQDFERFGDGGELR